MRGTGPGGDGSEEGECLCMLPRVNLMGLLRRGSMGARGGDESGEHTEVMISLTMGFAGWWRRCFMGYF